MYADFERALDEAVAAGHIAGAVALTVDPQRVTYHHSAGRRSVDGPAPMTPDSVFWIASMTKAIVSVAALQLVAAGKLSLDGDLAGLLPDLKDLEVFDQPGPDGVWTTRPASGPVTLRQLLSHTSGFGYNWLDARIGAWAKATGAPDQVSGLRAAHRQPLLFDPGQGWAYGIGIDWAGIAIEAASGQRLDAYLADHLLGPLGMADTGFALSQAQQDRAAGMHARTRDDALVAIPFAMRADPEVLSGGGGLYSTAADYGRFLRMLLNRGELDGARVLEPELFAVLGEVQTGARRAGAWTSISENLSHDIDLFPGILTGWGLATMITPQPGPNGRSAGSLSWGGLANTYYWADCTAGKAGLLLAQMLPFGDPDVLRVFGALERAVYA